MTTPSASIRSRPSPTRGAPRRGPGRGGAVRVAALGEHAEQVRAALAVDQLQAAGGAGGARVGAADDDADDVGQAGAVAAADGEQVDLPLLVGLLQRLPVLGRGDLDRVGAAAGHGVQALGQARAGHRAHHVVVVDGRPGAGPGVGDGGPAARAVAHPQHEVGEAQVGDELPVPHQGPQPLDVGLGDVGVTADDVGDGGHRTRLPWPAGTPRRGVTLRRAPTAPGRERADPARRATTAAGQRRLTARRPRSPT